MEFYYAKSSRREGKQWMLDESRRKTENDENFFFSSLVFSVSLSRARLSSSSLSRSLCIVVHKRLRESKEQIAQSTKSKINIFFLLIFLTLTFHSLTQVGNFSISNMLHHQEHFHAVHVYEFFFRCATCQRFD